MSTDPGTNLMRLGRALEPFQDSDIVMVFGSEGGTAVIRSSLEEIAAPDLVTLMIGADQGLTGTFHGIEGFIEAWADYSATFKELRNRIAELVEVNPDVIYAETRQTGLTVTAGIEIDYSAAAIFRIAAGRLEQAEFHLDRAAARRAAGIVPDRH